MTMVPGVAWQDATVADLEVFLDNVPVGYPVLRADPFDPLGSVEAPRVLPMTGVTAPAGRKSSVSMAR